MSRTKKSMVTDLSSNDSYMLQLLYSVLIITIFMLVFFVFDRLNVRESTNVTYSELQQAQLITDDEANKPVFISNRWTVVPNFKIDNIYENLSIEDIQTTYHHADNAEITEQGWDNLGSNVLWNNSNDNVIYEEFINNSIPTISCAYMTTLECSVKNSNLYLDLGDINGHAYVYCNNNYIGEAGDLDEYAILPNYAGGHNSISLPTNSSTLEIIIVCYANSKIASPGLISIPTLLPQVYNTILSTIPIAWMAVILTISLIAIIVGFHLGGTFKDKRIYCFFILTVVNIVLYNIVDNHFLIMDSITKQAGRMLFFICSATFSYCFVAFIFSKKRIKYLGNADCIVVSCLGVAFIMLSFLDSRLLSTPYNEVCAIVYVSIIAATSIGKVLLLHLNSKNALFGITASITLFFIFYSMLSQHNLLCNVSLYSIMLFFGLLGILGSFIRKYILQYNELVNNATHLKLAIEQKTAHISEINKDLINTNKKLLSNEEARKNVMSNVSHDLRTPITAIRGYAELLIKGENTMSPEQKSTYLNNILKRSQQMERIVSDIVEISKMESSNFEFNYMDLSIVELLDELYMLYSADLSENKKLRLELPENDDFLMVKADPKRLSRVFENLISNAINYSKETADIQIKAWRSDADKPLSEQRVHITVSDDGIGIPSNEIERIFDRFYRAKNSGQNIKGTGLGLSIVKMIIDKHDAEISVESQIGVGTTFHIIMKPTY